MASKFDFSGIDFSKYTNKEIAEKVGCCETTVRLYKKINGIQKPKIKVRKPKFDFSGISNEELAHTKEIAAKLGCSEWTVTFERSKRGVTLKTRNIDFSSVNWELSNEEIARGIGCTYATVYRKRKELGKPKPVRRKASTTTDDKKSSVNLVYSGILNDVKLEDLDKEYYSVFAASQILGCPTRKVYKYAKHKENGKFVLSKREIVYIAKHENDIAKRRAFSKSTGLYPKRRRTGNYKDYYREIEVLYKLGITKEELNNLVGEGKLTRTKFSKKGEKRVGYNIMEVLEYADSVDIKA